MATTNMVSSFAADNLRVVRSKHLDELADGTYKLIVLPRYSLLMDVWVYISQAYAGGGVDGTMTVGFTGNGESDDADGIMDAIAVDATAAGWKRAVDDAQPASAGKWFNSAAGGITVTLADNTCTTLLKGYVFASFTVIH